MTHISIDHAQQPLFANDRILGWLKVSAALLTRRILIRRQLTAELERLPDHALQDIGLLPDDVASIRKTGLLEDCSAQLSARLQKRRAVADVSKP